MSALVVLHVALGRERFVAEFADEGLLLRVYPNVDDQIRPLRESLVAVRVRAL